MAFPPYPAPVAMEIDKPIDEIGTVFGEKEYRLLSTIHNDKPSLSKIIQHIYSFGYSSIYLFNGGRH
ncbi:MAG: hypothetical protein WC716_14220 [Chitinophagaceae bacterium]